MCYSVKTSILSFSLGLIASIFAFLSRQFILGTLILFYSQMQLSEAIIWRGIDTKNISLNKMGTSYGKYLLPTHNIAIGIGILLSIIFVDKKILKPTDFIPLVVGIIFFVCIVILQYSRKQYNDITYPANPSCIDRSCQNNENRLRWPYPHHWYMISYVISLIFLLIYIKPLASKIFLGSMFSITFFMSAILVPKSVGSVWCFSTAILAPVLVLGNYFMINKASY